MSVCGRGLEEERVTAPPTVTETPGFEIQGFHVWPAACVSDTCCAISGRGSCVEEAGDELHPEVCVLS